MSRSLLVLRPRWTAWLLIAGLGCDPMRPDRDGDGWSGVSEGAERDCDDDDAQRHPAADERCNEADDDCDGAVDEGVTIEAFIDADGDGFGQQSVPACPGTSGTTLEGGDCDDTSAAARPGAEEVCGDGVDQDCAVTDACRLEGEQPWDGGLTFTFDYTFDINSVIFGWPDLDGDGRPEVAFGQWFYGSAAQSLAILPSEASWAPGVTVPGATATWVIDDTTELTSGAAAWIAGAPRVVTAHRGFTPALYLYDLGDPGAGEAVQRVARVFAPDTVSAADVDERQDSFGTDLRALGDLDGDGLPELGVTDERATGLSGAASAGRVDVLFGDDAPLSGDLTLSDLSWRIDGATASDNLGLRITSGDADGDGQDELFVTSGRDGITTGAGFWFKRSLDDEALARTSADAWSRVHSDGLGSGDWGAAVEVAELTGDDAVDLVVSAPNMWSDDSGGVVYLFPGPLEAGVLLLADGDTAFDSRGALGSAFGLSLTTLDLDGDGQRDLAASDNAYMTGQDGLLEQVTVYYGPLSPDGPGATATFTPEADHPHFGLTLARLPDASGPGVDGLLVSDSSNDLGHLYFGQGD